MKKRTLGMLLALALALGCLAGGTLAYLTAQTETVTNTFTVGNVAIELTETKAPDGTQLQGAWEAKLIPGATYAKNPVVSVDADSEDCYLFVKVDAPQNSALVYTSTLTAANGWTKLEGENIWYRTVNTADADRSWNLIANDTVAISADLTNESMPETALTLTYTAYAVQTAGFDSAAQAWGETFGA